MKKFKIMVELDSNWLEEEQGEGLLQMLGEFKRRFKDRVYDKAVDEVIKHTKLPKVKISAKEIKNKMLEIMADKGRKGLLPV